MTNIYHNAIRHCLISEIRKFQQQHQLPYSGIPLLYHRYLVEFLRQTESLNPEEFTFKNSPSLLIDIAEILNNMAPTDSYLIEFNKTMQAYLKTAERHAIVPHRRVLNKTEWNYVWERIEDTKKSKIHQVFFEEDENEFQSILDTIAQENKCWYVINPLQYRYSYHLSGAWIKEFYQGMYSGNDNYWIDESFTECIYADAYGYPQVYR